MFEAKKQVKKILPVTVRAKQEALKTRFQLGLE